MLHFDVSARAENSKKGQVKTTEEERDRCEGEEVTHPPPHAHLLPPLALRPFPQSSDLPNVKHNKQFAAHQVSIHHRCLYNSVTIPPQLCFNIYKRQSRHTIQLVQWIQTGQSRTSSSLLRGRRSSVFSFITVLPFLFLRFTDLKLHSESAKITFFFPNMRYDPLHKSCLLLCLRLFRWPCVVVFLHWDHSPIKLLDYFIATLSLKRTLARSIRSSLRFS